MSTWRMLVVVVGCVVTGMAAQACAPQEAASEVEEVVARSLPTFEVDEGWMKVPEQWKLGDASSFSSDSSGNIWLLHRPWTLPAEDAAMAAPPIMVFDSDGNFIKALGGPGEGYDWVQREHGLHIDSEDFVWVTGNNCPTNGLPREPVADDQVLKFAPDGSFVMQIGHVGDGTASNADTENVHRAADAWVHPATRELFVADGYGNSRVVVFDADTGAFKRMWGAFGRAPVDDPPAQPAPPATARAADGEGSPQFGIVHGLKVSKDGLVYVADRGNSRIQVFSLDGKYVTQVFINRNAPSSATAAGIAFSPDREQQFMYVADYGNSRIVVVDRKRLEVVDQFGEKGPEPGNFRSPHHIATDSKGNLYTAEVVPGARVQRFVFKGMTASDSR